MYAPESVTVSDLETSQLDSNGQPPTRFRHAAGLCGDQLYVHGGRSGHRALRDFWRLNIEEESPSWKAVKAGSCSADQPGLLEDHLLVTHGTKLLLVGNRTDSLNKSVMQIWILQKDVMCWLRPAANPAGSLLGRRSSTGTVVAKKLYIVGGIVDLYAKPTAEVIEFELDRFTWNAVKANGPLVLPALYEHSAVAHTGRLYVFGGVKEQKAGNSVWIFDLGTQRKSWTRVPATGRQPPNRHGHVAIATSHSMIIHGGRNEQGLLGDMWSFQFTSEIWTNITLAQPCPLAYHVALWLPVGPEGGHPVEPQPVGNLDFTENYFSDSSSESNLRCDSQEQLIRIAGRRASHFAYDNAAVELDVVVSRKLSRNSSATSEQRAREKSKKIKSTQSSRSGMQSLTNTAQMHDEANHRNHIELSVMSTQTCSNRTRSDSNPKELFSLELTQVCHSLPSATIGKILLIGGDSDQGPLIGKQTMPIRVLHIA